MESLISVIVPVYNAEAYLDKCIGSILNQSYVNLECVLVNDGSTDRSGEICAEYAVKDKRVRVYHQENGGVSTARNLGIKKAKGEFTIHLDSDDYISLDMLEVMYNKMAQENCDILIADFYNEVNGIITKYKQNLRDTTPETIIKQILEGSIHGSVCNKLIRASLYKNSNIKFNIDIPFCEDLLFNIQCLLTNPKIAKVDQAFLFYVQRESSAIRTYNESMFIGLFKLVDILDKTLGRSYEKSLCYFKLLVKRLMIISRRFSNQEIINTYKESHKFIFQNTEFQLSTKIYIYMAVNGFYPIVKFLQKLR